MLPQVVLMASNSATSRRLPHRRSDSNSKKVVVVKASETSYNPSQTMLASRIKELLFTEDDAQKVQKNGLIAFKNNTRIEFPFDGVPK
jgi:hypothetical protein